MEKISRVFLKIFKLYVISIIVMFIALLFIHITTKLNLHAIIKNLVFNVKGDKFSIVIDTLTNFFKDISLESINLIVFGVFSLFQFFCGTAPIDISVNVMTILILLSNVLFMAVWIKPMMSIFSLTPIRRMSIDYNENTKTFTLSKWADIIYTVLLFLGELIFSAIIFGLNKIAVHDSVKYIFVVAFIILLVIIYFSLKQSKYEDSFSIFRTFSVVSTLKDWLNELFSLCFLVFIFFYIFFMFANVYNSFGDFFSLIKILLGTLGILITTSGISQNTIINRLIYTIVNYIIIIIVLII